MRKNSPARLVVAAASLALSGMALAAAPAGSIEKGSYANQVLARDALIGVTAKVRSEGCSSPERYQPYVMKKPNGTAGSRTWSEQWVVQGCGKEYPITLNFREEGAKGASWRIVN
ncbi:hypothetical protein [Candidimonas nitroreducens]|uniref:Uncharacterized protein n=1 Tax=Candidimonas nitroreducens TaxID=683354 RepID=A0A225MGS5_9BURK|nr:hypothetical protein [Candidimonas nitroreducens]OWT60557.1 hypothetical protein CEY11_09990 [Candidimonas nitroreducens]